MNDSHLGAPLAIELEDGTPVLFARMARKDWTRWTRRVAARSYRLVLRAMLASDAPAPAAHAKANEELTRPRPLNEVAATIASGDFVAAMLRERAAAAGCDPDLVDRVPALDLEPLATMLLGEEVPKLPFLIPLSRHRARERAKIERAERILMARTMLAGIVASATPSLPPTSGSTSDFGSTT